jgi:hypothetical protein
MGRRIRGLVGYCYFICFGLFGVTWEGTAVVDVLLEVVCVISGMELSAHLGCAVVGLIKIVIVSPSAFP